MANYPYQPKKKKKEKGGRSEKEEKRFVKSREEEKIFESPFSRQKVCLQRRARVVY